MKTTWKDISSSSSFEATCKNIPLGYINTHDGKSKLVFASTLHKERKQDQTEKNVQQRVGGKAKNKQTPCGSIIVFINPKRKWTQKPWNANFKLIFWCIFLRYSWHCFPTDNGNCFPQIVVCIKVIETFLFSLLQVVPIKWLHTRAFMKLNVILICHVRFCCAHSVCYSIDIQFNGSAMSRLCLCMTQLKMA